MKKTRAKITLNVQHDYITLKLPVGNFTKSYGGTKTSGQLVTMKGAFDAIDNYIKNKSKETKKNFGEIMQELTNPDVMDALVPGWDQPKVVVLAGGDTVKFSEPAYAKRYPASYPVAYVKGKYAYISVPNKIGGTENIGFPLYSLEKI